MPNLASFRHCIVRRANFHKFRDSIWSDIVYPKSSQHDVRGLFAYHILKMGIMASIISRSRSQMEQMRLLRELCRVVDQGCQDFSAMLIPVVGP